MLKPHWTCLWKFSLEQKGRNFVQEVIKSLLLRSEQMQNQTSVKKLGPSHHLFYLWIMSSFTTVLSSKYTLHTERTPMVSWYHSFLKFFKKSPHNYLYVIWWVNYMFFISASCYTLDMKLNIIQKWQNRNATR